MKNTQAIQNRALRHSPPPGPKTYLDVKTMCKLQHCTHQTMMTRLAKAGLWKRAVLDKTALHPKRVWNRDILDPVLGPRP